MRRGVALASGWSPSMERAGASGNLRNATNSAARCSKALATCPSSLPATSGPPPPSPQTIREEPTRHIGTKITTPQVAWTRSISRSEGSMPDWSGMPRLRGGPCLAGQKKALRSATRPRGHCPDPRTVSQRMPPSHPWEKQGVPPRWRPGPPPNSRVSPGDSRGFQKCPSPRIGDDLEEARRSDRGQRDRFPPSRRSEIESLRAVRAARWRLERPEFAPLDVQPPAFPSDRFHLGRRAGAAAPDRPEIRADAQVRRLLPRPSRPAAHPPLGGGTGAPARLRPGLRLRGPGGSRHAAQ
jgi:hypothetical protein